MLASRHLLLACGVMLVVAYCSQGFYHPDEHYMLLEWVRLVEGANNPQITDTFEYQRMIRPWFQPYLFFYLKLALAKAGVTSPFSVAFALRALSGAIGALTLWLLTPLFCTGQLGARRLFWGAVLAAYIPFLLVRPSADVWGASFLMMGVALLLRAPDLGPRQLLGPALLWVLALLCRYQVLIFIAPFGIHLLLQSWSLRSTRWALAATATFTLLLWLLIEGFANFKGYGVWTLSSWNHASLNVLQGYSHNFGTLPWWGYGFLLLKHPMAPLSGAALVAYLRFWWRHPRSPLTTASLTYLLFFSLLGHKEIRFLMPLIYLAPFLVVRQWPRMRALYWGINIPLLLICSLKSAYPPVNTYEAIFHHWQQSPAPLYVVRAADPLELQLRFYLPPQVKEETRTPQELIQLVALQTPFYLVTHRLVDAKTAKEQLGCLSLQSSYPQWIVHLNFGHWMERSNIWGLWRCGVR